MNRQRTTANDCMELRASYGRKVSQGTGHKQKGQTYKNGQNCTQTVI